MNNLIRHNNHLKQSRILLKQFFCATSQQSMTQPRKRTVINHIAGQIVTEEDVIKQLEQKKKQLKKQHHVLLVNNLPVENGEKQTKISMIV